MYKYASLSEQSKSINALSGNFNWKYAGQFLGSTRFELPSHKELWVLLCYQSNLSISRALHIANVTALETDILGVSDNVIDYVHIYYHGSAMGMVRTSNPNGIVSFLAKVWYR